MRSSRGSSTASRTVARSAASALANTLSRLLTALPTPAPRSAAWICAASRPVRTRTAMSRGRSGFASSVTVPVRAPRRRPTQAVATARAEASR
jgi:hypothetical protein